MYWIVRCTGCDLYLSFAQRYLW